MLFPCIYRKGNGIQFIHFVFFLALSPFEMQILLILCKDGGQTERLLNK